MSIEDLEVQYQPSGNHWSQIATELDRIDLAQTHWLSLWKSISLGLSSVILTMLAMDHFYRSRIKTAPIPQPKEVEIRLTKVEQPVQNVQMFWLVRNDADFDQNRDWNEDF
ncbi:MAG: hypothetical protein AAF203_09365 [Pseudomonadota bacterium]